MDTGPLVDEEATFSAVQVAVVVAVMVRVTVLPLDVTPPTSHDTSAAGVAPVTSHLKSSDSPARTVMVAASA